MTSDYYDSAFARSAYDTDVYAPLDSYREVYDAYQQERPQQFEEAYYNVKPPKKKTNWYKVAAMTAGIVATGLAFKHRSSIASKMKSNLKRATDRYNTDIYIHEDNSRPLNRRFTEMRDIGVGIAPSEFTPSRFESF